MNNAKITSKLYKQLPKDQVDVIMKSDNPCDIDSEFLGFVGIYRNLSKIIPLHFTVIDLGCSYAPQAFFFKKHAAYIGVDIGTGPRFTAENSTHIISTISDYITQYEKTGPTFAICSYVPPWHDDNCKLVRENFENCFVYYPESNISIHSLFQ